MKDSYTIHEIAALYGVGPDALRYYEKLGLIKPRRAQNGYRIYDLNDIYRLTILRDLGGQKIGASIAPEDIRAGREGVYRSVFFLLKEGEAGDFTLPGGAHARLFYRGGYRQLGTRIAALLSWARALGLFPTGDVLELYHIDNRFTAREEEFLTELQVRLEPEKEEREK